VKVRDYKRCRAMRTQEWAETMEPVASGSVALPLGWPFT
jgi:hypothetical protein